MNLTTPPFAPLTCKVPFSLSLSLFPFFLLGEKVGVLSAAWFFKGGRDSPHRKINGTSWNTRRSLRSGILHSLRLQEPQTGASIWASASRLTPSPPFPLPPLSLSLSLPGFGRAPRLEDPSPSPCPPPFFYLLFHRGNFGPKVDQLSRYCFIPFPLPSPFRVFTGAPVGSRYYCVFLPPSLPPSAGKFPVSFVHPPPLLWRLRVTLVSRRFFLSRDEKF